MNQVQSDALDEVLVARAAMYGLLQRVFSDVPDRALAENESCEVMDQCFEVLGEAWGLRDCRTCKVGEGAGPKVPEQDIDAVPLTLEGEYNRLFVGVGKPAVCMWESIYATGINALFQPNTLEVRNVYLRNGFKPLGMGKVADDHMAIELAFMRELALETTRAGEAQRASLLTDCFWRSTYFVGSMPSQNGSWSTTEADTIATMPVCLPISWTRMPLSCREPLLKRFCRRR